MYWGDSVWWHVRSIFSVWFYMDFIGLLFLLGWSIRGRSWISPLGLFRGLFLFLRCEIGNFLGFADCGWWFFWGAVVGERYCLFVC